MARITVFCGSSDKVSPLLRAEAELFGRRLALAGHELIYGGANVGLMGILADGALAAGGRLIGVVPQLDFALDIVHAGLHETHKVKTLWERKQMMIERADALVVFPGGLGTLDEVTDALVLKQTGELDRPVFFLNLFDYWSPFLEALTVMVESRMIHAPLENLFTVVDRVETLMSHLDQLKRVGENDEAFVQ